MQGLNDDERKAVLGEVLTDELKAITEYVKEIPHIKKKVDTVEEDMKDIKSDIKVIKAAITDVSREQKEHEVFRFARTRHISYAAVDEEKHTD